MNMLVGQASAAGLGRTASGEQPPAEVVSLFWASIGCGALSSSQTQGDSAPLCIGTLSRILDTFSVPPLIVVCFKYGARETAQRLCQLHPKVAVLWVHFDVMADRCDDWKNTKDLLRLLVMP